MKGQSKPKKRQAATIGGLKPSALGLVGAVALAEKEEKSFLKVKTEPSMRTSFWGGHLGGDWDPHKEPMTKAQKIKRARTKAARKARRKQRRK